MSSMLKRFKKGFGNTGANIKGALSKKGTTRSKSVWSRNNKTNRGGSEWNDDYSDDDNNSFNWEDLELRMKKYMLNGEQEGVQIKEKAKTTHGREISNKGEMAGGQGGYKSKTTMVNIVGTEDMGALSINVGDIININCTGPILSKVMEAIESSPELNLCTVRPFDNNGDIAAIYYISDHYYQYDIGRTDTILTVDELSKGGLIVVVMKKGARKISKPSDSMDISGQMEDTANDLVRRVLRKDKPHTMAARPAVSDNPSSTNGNQRVHENPDTTRQAIPQNHDNAIFESLERIPIMWKYCSEGINTELETEKYIDLGGIDTVLDLTQVICDSIDDTYNRPTNKPQPGKGNEGQGVEITNWHESIVGIYCVTESSCYDIWNADSNAPVATWFKSIQPSGAGMAILVVANTVSFLSNDEQLELPKDELSVDLLTNAEKIANEVVDAQ